MAISTQTQALVKLYQQRISLLQKQIYQVNTVESGYTINVGIGSNPIRFYGVNETLQNYSYPIQKLDTKIVQLNDQINSLQQQVLDLGNSATSVGCGTTSNINIVYRDDLKYKTYSFSSPNPYAESQGNLTSSNLGIGTNNFINQVSIGSYYGDIGNCYIIDCNNQVCAGFANSITALNLQISEKQIERNNLLGIVNILKSNRIEFQMQKYAYDESKNRLNLQIINSTTIINFLQNPAYQEFL